MLQLVQIQFECALDGILWLYSQSPHERMHIAYVMELDLTLLEISQMHTSFHPIEI